MATTIKLKNGSGAPLAGDLVQGEPALDLTNKRLYTENASGTVIEVGTNPSTLTVDTDVLVVDATNNRVGIGTTSVGTKLNIRSDVSDDGILLEKSDGTDIARLFHDGVTTNARLDLFSGGSATVQIKANGDTHFSGGNVGINRQSPNGLLHMQSASGTDSAFYIQTSAATDDSVIYFGDNSASQVGSILYEHSSNSLQFASNGSERMRIDSAGKVGVGITNPSGSFHVTTKDASGSDVYYVAQNTTSNRIAGYRILDEGNNVGGAFQYDNGGNTLLIGASTSSDFQFMTSGTERMRITSSGRFNINHATSGTAGTGSFIVGASSFYIQASENASSATRVPIVFSAIGGTNESMRIDSSGRLGIFTSAPSSRLHVLDSSTTWAAQIHNNNGTHGAGLFIRSDSTNDPMVLGVYGNGSYRMVVRADGKVGIGSGSSGSLSTALEVSGDSSGVANNITTYNANTGASAEASIDWSLERTGSAAKIRAARISAGKEQSWTTTASTVDGYMRFLTVRDESLNEAMRIDSVGDLLVGKTTGGVTAAAGFTVQPQGNGGASPFVSSSSDASVNSHITWAAYSRGASAYRFYVGYGGQIYATSTSISAISDESLKENIRDLDKGLETINALQPRRFDWKNGDGNDIMGFVAQEVEGVLPELVADYKYSEEETKLGLKMGDMIPSMVKAIQELSTQVDELKAEVAALKGA